MKLINLPDLYCISITSTIYIYLGWVRVRDHDGAVVVSTPQVRTHACSHVHATYKCILYIYNEYHIFISFNCSARLSVHTTGPSSSRPRRYVHIYMEHLHLLDLYCISIASTKYKMYIGWVRVRVHDGAVVVSTPQVPTNAYMLACTYRNIIYLIYTVCL